MYVTTHTPSQTVDRAAGSGIILCITLTDTVVRCGVRIGRALPEITALRKPQPTRTKSHNSDKSGACGVNLCVATTPYVLDLEAKDDLVVSSNVGPRALREER